MSLADYFSGRPRGLAAAFGSSRSATAGGMADWQIAQMAGADQATVEQLRLESSMYGPEGLANVSRSLGQEPAGEQRGVLEASFDVLTRLQSAVTGAATGALGLERVRRTYEGGEFLETPEREGALTRFTKGLTGQEKYQAADFAGLAYDRETASVGERVVKSATGFVLDVALDPLTYVSFGGSILGRKAGAVAVNAQARKRLGEFIPRMTTQQKQDLIRESVSRQGIDSAALRANLTNIMREGGMDDLVAKMPPEFMSVDDLIETAGNLGALDSLTMDALASSMAGVYRAMGFGGVRSMLKEGFGEFGEQMAARMPLDLQGGIRIRVPFARGEDGLPTAYRLGEGRLLESIPGGEKLRSLSNQGREYMRQLPIFRSGGDNMSGRLGASDRRLASEIFNKEVDRMGRLWGQLDERGTISWTGWNNLNNSLADFRAGSFSAMRHLISDVNGAQEAHALGVTGANRKEYLAAFNDLMKEDLVGIPHFRSDATRLKKIDDIYGANPTAAQRQAFESASYMQMALKRTESVLMDAFDGSVDRIFEGLEQYWPRMVEDLNRAIGRGGRSANLLSRDNYISVISVDPNTGVLRWMTPPDIKARYANVKGARVFEDDPIAALIPYVISMNRMAAQENLIKNLLDNGVIFRAGPEMTTELSNLAGVDGAIAGARDMRARLLAARQELADIGPLGNVDRVNQAARVLYSFRRLGKRLPNSYAPVDLGPAGSSVRSARPGVSAAWSSVDGTEVQELAVGGFRSWVPRRGYLGVDGKFYRDPAKAASFPDRLSAENGVNQILRPIRDAEYAKDVQRAADEFLDGLSDGIRTLEDSAGYDPARNVFDVSNIPMDASAQEQYFDSIVNVLKQYGDNKSYKTRKNMGDVYKQQGRAYGLVSEASADSPQMRQYMEERFKSAGIFSQEGLVDDVRRIFEAQANPNAYQKWVNDFYRPFYAAQKAMMTSLRGPGYVARNIVGGMWNAYLVGVTARHWQTARAVQVVAHEAENFARSQSGDSATQYRLAADKFRELLEQRFGKNKAAEMRRAWEVYQMRGGARSVAGRTVGTQAVVRPTGIEGGIVDPIDQLNQSRMQQISQRITADNPWARFMTSMSADSEDFLRFGTFLKGVDDFGLDDGGYAAMGLVKASQFDYGDLSNFEAGTLKMLVPFYTWTRNNVPLQLRALMTQPRYVNNALRINDALRDAFGEYEDDQDPLPSFVRERFGWAIRKDLLKGPMGDALAGGLVVGEPLVDINRLIRTTGGRGIGNVLNIREAANNLNPVFSVGAEALTGIELSTGGRMAQTEEAPLWALPFSRRDASGERVVSSRALRTARSVLPPLSILERLFPQAIGNERYERRVYTSWASQLFGLPVSTLDPFQVGAELRARESATRGRLTRIAGDTLQDKVEFMRPLAAAGIPPQDLALIRAMVVGKPNATAEDFLRAPADRVDPQMGLSLALQIQAVSKMTDPVARAQAFGRLQYNPRPVARRGRPTLTEEDLRELGLTPEDVGKMSRAEMVRVLDAWVQSR